MSIVGCKPNDSNDLKEGEQNPDYQLEASNLFTPEGCPHISFIIPEGYEAFYEHSGSPKSSQGLWSMTFYNSEKDRAINISYLDYQGTEDGSWKELVKWKTEPTPDIIVQYHEEFTVGETVDYMIFEMSDNKYNVLPKDWENIVGSISVHYDNFYMGSSTSMWIDTDDGDRDAAYELAESITQSKLTKEKYDEMIAESEK